MATRWFFQTGNVVVRVKLDAVTSPTYARSYNVDVLETLPGGREFQNTHIGVPAEARDFPYVADREAKAVAMEAVLALVTAGGIRRRACAWRDRTLLLTRLTERGDVMNGLGWAPERHKLNRSTRTGAAGAHFLAALRYAKEGDCEHAVKLLTEGEHLLGEALANAQASDDRAQITAVEGAERYGRAVRAIIVKQCIRGQQRLLGLGDPWTPTVVRGDGGGLYTIPENQEQRSIWAQGFSRGVTGQRPYFPNSDLPSIESLGPTFREGYAVGRRLRNDAAAVNRVWEEIRAMAPRPQPKPRKRRMHPNENPRYVVQNRGPQGSGKGTFITAGGPLLTVRKLAEHFATEDTPARSQGSLWTDGIILYSYMQPIAKKRVMASSLEPGNLGRICAMDPRAFSPTTTKQQTMVGGALRRHGWRIAYRNLGGPKTR